MPKIIAGKNALAYFANASVAKEKKVLWHLSLIAEESIAVIVEYLNWKKKFQNQRKDYLSKPGQAVTDDYL